MVQLRLQRVTDAEPIRAATGRQVRETYILDVLKQLGLLHVIIIQCHPLGHFVQFDSGTLHGQTFIGLNRFEWL